jgi:Phosphate-induced protein 1 conserved region
VRHLRGGLLVLAASMLLAPAAGAFVSRTPTGHRVGLMLRARAAQARLKGAKSRVRPSSAVVQYHGGPVLHSETPYLIFWEPGGSHMISPSSKSVLTQYLTDVARDSGASNNVYGVLAQYTDATGTGAMYQQTFGGAQVIDDTQAYPAQSSSCSLATGVTACVTDAQIQAEISRLIGAGRLPTGTGANAPIYFMITPTDVNVCLGGGQCASNNFCAYHDYFTLSGAPVLYASVPFEVWANGSVKGCQDDGTSVYQSPAGPYHGDPGYQIADNLSHELSETITDPLINAWFAGGNGSEVGDLCEAYASVSDTRKDVSSLAYSPILSGGASAGTLTDQLFEGDYYYTQTEWSNARNACSATPAT